jgi:fatty acid desaturase
MTTHAHKTQRAFRLGWEAGHALRRIASLDRKACRWLAARGLPVGTAKIVLWAIKLAVLAFLLYVAFWGALLLTFFLVVAWVGRNSSDWQDENKPEWREGHSGFGLYDKNEWRHDMGDPDGP